MFMETVYFPNYVPQCSLNYNQADTVVEILYSIQNWNEDTLHLASAE